MQRATAATAKQDPGATCSGRARSQDKSGQGPNRGSGVRSGARRMLTRISARAVAGRAARAPHPLRIGATHALLQHALHRRHSGGGEGQYPGHEKACRPPVLLLHHDATRGNDGVGEAWAQGESQDEVPAPPARRPLDGATQGSRSPRHMAVPWTPGLHPGSLLTGQTPGGSLVRKREEEGAAATNGTLNPDPPPVAFDDPAYDGEAYSGALAFIP